MTSRRLIGQALVFVMLVAQIGFAGPGVADPVGFGGGVPGDPTYLTDMATQTSWFRWTPSGETIVYASGPGPPITGPRQVYQQPATGGTVIPLSGPIAGHEVKYLYVSPDGSHVVYVADQYVDDQFELMSVPLGGGTPVRLSGDVVSGGDVEPYDVQFTPDGSTVLWKGDVVLDGLPEVFATPIAGGPRLKLSLERTINGPGIRFDIAPDGHHVVYVAEPDGRDRTLLYATPISHRDTIRLSPPGTRQVSEFEFTKTGDRVLYVANIEYGRRHELHEVPLTGGPSTKLSGPMAVGGAVTQLAVTADDQYVVYTADQDTDDVQELYSAALDGSGWKKLNSPLPDGADVGFLTVSPTGSQVIVKGDLATLDVKDLWTVPASGATPPLRLNPELTGSWVEGHTFTADGSTVVFAAPTGPDGEDRVYAAPIEGGEPIWISRSAGTFRAIGADHLGFQLLADNDGDRLTFVGWLTGESVPQLFSVRLNGDAPLKLTTNTGRGLYPLLLSPDNRRIASTDGGRLFNVGVRNYGCGGRTATHIGTMGDDIFAGSNDDDVMVGFEGADTMSGRAGDDRVCGRSGNDNLKGGIGNDRLFGEYGDDLLNGRTGNDVLLGQRGNDTIYGARGKDLLRGGYGRDTLFGGADDDDMRGGYNVDSCDGGDGIDTAHSCQPTNVP